MGLFEPAWKHKDPQKRIRGITKLSDQEILKQIAATDPNLEVRLAAIEKITDELFLTQLCLALKHSDVSKACLNRIRTKQFLLELALKDQTTISQSCFDRIKTSLNKEELHTILFEAADSGTRRQAASITDNYDDLLELALKDKTVLAEECVEKLKPSIRKADLRLIIFKAVNNNAQNIALHYAEDYNDILEYVLLRHPNESRRNAVAYIIEEHKTPRIFWNAVIKFAERETMSYAIENLLRTVLSDMKQEDLLCVATDSRIISFARETAIKKLSDNDALLKLYNNQGIDENVKKAAIEAMSDEKVLLKIAHEDKNERACLKLSGYLCTSCRRENLPEDGELVSCTCRHCHTENHKFERKHKTIEHNRSSETASSWDECVRCGATSNYKSEFRYTDW